ncbi:NusG domain II-containing protein [Amphibacillus sp. Q70]|uniref:NusG domain II-containing protein n=1 Tax=Amphibacillus sp. Q70 TaxID=3453416 RepID=UPI003F85064B
MWSMLKKQMKPMDFVVIIFFVILSFIPLLWFNVHHASPSQDHTVAVISIDGEVVDEFVLSEDTPHQEVTYYPNEGQYNIIEIDGPRIRVKEDNSPDQIAVQTSWIERPGQTSICLPHRLIIEIKGTSDYDDDVIY